MPCRDTGPSFESAPYLAMLCGIVTVLHKQHCLDEVLRHVDWAEAGVSRRHFDDWWRQHQEVDAARQRQELAERRQNELRYSAAAKLTPEERKALGL